MLHLALAALVGVSAILCWLSPRGQCLAMGIAGAVFLLMLVATSYFVFASYHHSEDPNNK